MLIKCHKLHFIETFSYRAIERSEVAKNSGYADFSTTTENRLESSGPHLINDVRYLPQEKCLSLSEQTSLIKTFLSS